MLKKLGHLSGSVERRSLPESVWAIAVMVNSCISTINQLIDKVEKLEAEIRREKEGDQS